MRNTTRASMGVLGAITLLGIASASLLAADALGWGRREGGDEFQKLVRGLGMGPALTMSRCVPAFDPRLCGDWRAAHPPVVCGEYYCPYHASSGFTLPPLQWEVPPDGEATNDAKDL